MTQTLQAHRKELKARKYQPRFLAVDEFAIHKGHRYATCVMDLETGEVLWVGKGAQQGGFHALFRGR